MSSIHLALFAQATNTQQDSTDFETQRTHVNNLLNLRSQKFGEYTASLEQKSGIFGIFKTKGDMQKSIDILKNIVITDNDIFIETKRLLNIKDYEREKYQRLANEYDLQITNYMKTISKLQAENEKLRTQIEHFENRDGQSLFFKISGAILFICMAVVIIVLYKRSPSKKVT